jgi:hypothetical protein
MEGKIMNTDKIAEQLFNCVMEGIQKPYNQENYSKKEKIKILENLIKELIAEKADIILYD